MFKMTLSILAGIVLFYHGCIYADEYNFKGVPDHKNYQMRVIRGYEIQPPPPWQKCGLRHRPCGVYAMPDSYYKQFGKQPQSDLLRDHR